MPILHDEHHHLGSKIWGYQVCCKFENIVIWQYGLKNKWSIILKSGDAFDSFLLHVGRIAVVHCHYFDNVVIAVAVIFWYFVFVAIAVGRVFESIGAVFAEINFLL